jgi:uncharacterized protein
MKYVVWLNQKYDMIVAYLSIGSSKKIPAIDFDSVLADTMITWLEEYSERSGTNITKNDIAHWDVSKGLRISVVGISRAFNYIWKYRWQYILPTEPNLNITTREYTKRIQNFDINKEI